MIKLSYNRIQENIEPTDLKRREGELRALRLKYTIEYPDGYKVHSEPLK